MIKIKYLVLAFSALFLSFVQVTCAEELTSKMSGKILLQVEDKGQAWYVYPLNNERAFLGRPADAFRIMRELGLGISEKDYSAFNSKAPSKLKGRILLRVGAKGEAYYVDTVSLKLHYLGRPDDAFGLMRELGLGITNANLSQIKVFEKYKEALEIEHEKNIVRMYSFYGEGCPHCAKENIFLEDLAKEFDNIQVIKYETWGNDENKELYDRVREEYNLEVYGVPLLVIGEETVYGFSDNETSGKRIREIVERQTRDGSKDIVFPLENNVHEVIKVVDGDTLDVRIGTEIKRVRIIGLNTPEIVDPRQDPECFGQEASDEAKKILDYQYVKLESDPSQDEVDKYGRLLRHVFLAGNINYAEQMIANGYAKEYTYSVASKYQNVYVQAETNAKENKKGMWADGACENIVKTDSGIVGEIQSDSDIFISYIFYDGVVGDNEGDEYVLIKNKGVASNLDGYRLSDESGKEYIFSNLNLGSGSELKLFTGCGTNTLDSVYWCYESSAIWNNDGDKAYLNDAQGNLLATYIY